MTDTVQRLKDLVAIADNKEVKLLANIMIEHINQDSKKKIGFTANKKDEE